MGSASVAGKAATSVDHSELSTDELERLERVPELLAAESGGHLRTDSCLAFRHDRVGEADDVDPMLEQPVGHAGREGGITEHHRDDRVLPGLEVEAGAREPLAEEARVLEQPRAQLRRALEQVEHRETR